jgi:diaminopimelate epimerase
MHISFSKYEGAGNDFILIDNRLQEFIPTPEQVRALCDRKLGIGADGLIALEVGMRAPFRMRIFNADGFEAEMCGNGLRCLKRFLEAKGVVSTPVLVETKERVLHIENEGQNVKTSMGDPKDLRLDISLERDQIVHFVNTGVPHAVQFVEDLETLDIETRGPFIRRHPKFGPKGANANFVKVHLGTLAIRTFERGVEGETLACGTGAVASAIIAALKYRLDLPIRVVPKSLETLTVDFQLEGDRIFNVTQTGPAQFIFQGSFYICPQK